MLLPHKHFKVVGLVFMYNNPYPPPPPPLVYIYREDITWPRGDTKFLFLC